MGWIDRIAQRITKAFDTIRPALPFIPPLLLICEIKQRPGLSAVALASAIIARLPEAGIETGVNNDGSPNKINGFVHIMCEELVSEIKNNARVSCVIEPGSVMGTGTGANAGGPIVVQTINTFLGQTCGIIE